MVLRAVFYTQHQVIDFCEIYNSTFPSFPPSSVIEMYGNRYGEFVSGDWRYETVNDNIHARRC